MIDKKIKFKNFEGQEFEFNFRKPRRETGADGLCYPPKNLSVSKIYVNPHMTKKRIREVIIHELIHAFFWDLPEYKVEKIAKVISKILNKFVYLSKNDS